MAITFPFRAAPGAVLERPIADPPPAAFKTESPRTAGSRADGARGSLPWHRLALLAILALSAFLELWQLNRLGTPNTFYAAAVLSMTQNVHAFFFNSLDPAGFVTIDKPPLGFWLQATSAKLLGFSGFSILLPEALATVGSVALLHGLVRRAAGELAGLLAALGLALMPIAVVVGRNNTIDASLVFTLLLATWAGFQAAERGSLKWLLLTAVLVGLGFEIKMLQAYLVLPALGLLYLLAAPLQRRTRALHLVAAAAVLLVVSLAWPVAVDLTPASQRPWIDSTQSNSAVDLALGYNGLDRLVGQGGSLSQFVAQLSGHTSASASAAAVGGPGGGNPAGANGGGMFNNGPAGVLRLFDQQLGGQASWLLPMALVGAGLAGWEAWRRRRGLASSRVGQSAIVWGGWLLAAGGFFSVANFFHSYYLVMLGPPIAALFGIGVAGVWRLWQQRSRPGRLLLPAALVGTAAVQASLLAPYPSYAAWLTPVALGGTVLGSLVLLLGGWLGSPKLRVAAPAALGIAVLALVAAPAVWGGQQTLTATANGLPAAGPAGAMSGMGPGGGPGMAPPNGQNPPSDGRGFAGRDGTADGANTQPANGAPQGGGMPGGPGGGNSAALDAYLLANQGSATYLVAVTDSNTAAPIILGTGKPVMSLGGFTGSDPILTAQQFAALVQQGVVRYVLGGGQDGPGGGSNTITSWVQANCTQVTLTGSSSGGGQGQVYDCAPTGSS